MDLAHHSFCRIQWDRQRETIHHLRSTGTLPSLHDSHDHLNEQIPVAIAESKCEEWKEKFRLLEETQDPKTIYVIADGFLMLYDEESVREFDVRLFVRDRYDVLKGRREERNGYVSLDIACLLFCAGGER